MIQIELRDYQILQKILSKYPYRFYAYGSRAKGTARKFSDLDLCYHDNIPDETGLSNKGRTRRKWFAIYCRIS